MGDSETSNRALCLDFVNTWENRLDPSKDSLSGIDELLEWACRGGLLSLRERRALGSSARRRPDEADAFLERSKELRERMFRIFSASAAGRAPDQSDIEELDRALAEVPRQRLRRGGECCLWVWPAADNDLARVLWPVIQSAADLVTSSELSRVRECAAPDCSWLFFDTGRGGRRRWCDMGTCGNRAKARRYYERHRGNADLS